MQQRFANNALTPNDQTFSACGPGKVNAQGQAFPHQIQADVDFGVLHETVGGADPKIQGRGYAGTAAHGCSVPGRDGDLVHVVERVDGAFADSRPAPTQRERPLIGVPWIGQVRAGREVFASAGEDDDSGFRVFSKGQRGVFDLDEVLEIQRVGLVWPVESHGRDVTRAGEENVFVAHLDYPVALENIPQPLMKTANWIQRNRSVAFIGSATAFSLLGDQVLYAVLPVYYESLHLTPIKVGIVLSANRWIRLLTNELAHRVATPERERPLFLGALALGAITTLAYALTTRFWLLLAARLAWGLAWSFIRHIGVQNVMVDIAGNRVGRAMGLYNGFSRAGSVVSLLGGAVLVDLFGFSAGVLMLAVVSLVSLPLAAKGLRSEGRVDPCVVVSDSVLPGALLVLGFVLGAVGPGFVMGTLGASIAGYVGTGGLFSAATLTGLLLGIRYLMDTAVAPWLGGATDRWGVRRASMVYLGVGGLALVMASSAPPLGLFVLAIILFFVCGTGLQAGVAGTASRHGSAAFARYVTASDFGSACGPLLGWLVVAWLTDPGLSLGLGGILYVLAILAATRLRG